MVDDVGILNNAGIQEFRAFLASIRANPHSVSPPMSLLRDAATSERITPPVAIEDAVLRTRLEAAVHINSLFSQLDAVRRAKYEACSGLWAWLSLYYFDQVKGVSRNRLGVGEDARYVLEAGRGIYRHLLRTSYLTYRIFRGDPRKAMVVLHQPLNQPGELVEQLAASQGLLAIPAVVEAYGRLYYSIKDGHPRDGAGGSGTGSPRRFVTFINQIDLTFDLGAMTADTIIEILPSQFDKFKRPQTPQPQNP